MDICELFLIAVGLSMDAFAVSVCKGLSVKKVTLKHSIIVGIYFGGFQALMPFLGYVLGTRFHKFIMSFDHWIAFALLTFIGINMIRESFSDDEKSNDSFNIKVMIPLAVATSIDALAVGVSFALLNIKILTAVTFIGVITFIITALGIKIGNIFGAKYKSKAELTGGIILIIIGIKVLLENFGIL